MELSDSILLERLRSSDRDNNGRGDNKEAFSILFQRYYPALYRFLFKLTGDSAEADDLAQDAFVTLFQKPPCGERQHNLRAWLYRVALNQGYNAKRAQRRASERHERAVQLAPRPLAPDPAESVLLEERRQAVRQTLHALPLRQQQCLMLRYEGFSYSEIAETLEIAPGSVGTILARAEKAFAIRYRESQRNEKE